MDFVCANLLIDTLLVTPKLMFAVFSWSPVNKCSVVKNLSRPVCTFPAEVELGEPLPSVSVLIL